MDQGPAVGGACNAVTMATAVEAWRTLSAVHQSAAVAAALAGYGGNHCHEPVPLPFAYQHYASGYGGIDVRRKNATRESTSTLKAWLYEHIKNPYPTKGEKIMLAIVTRMTLTQVSTWFANARRRLKKENKMQWSPRNRTGDDDDDDEDDDDDDNYNNNSSGSVDDGSRHLVVNEDEDDDIVVDIDNDDVNNGRHTPVVDFVSSDQNHFRREPLPLAVCGRTTMTSSQSRPELEVGIEQRRAEVKPRIWSLADVATSGSCSSSSYKEVNGCPRVSLGALWSPPSLSPIISNGFQPWTSGCTSSPVRSTMFSSGLFSVGGFLQPSSSEVKSPYPPRSESISNVESTRLSPESRCLPREPLTEH